MPRFALITGASSGLGLALAEALARRGRHLILVARQRDALESIAYELTQRFGVEVLYRTCDLSEPLQLSGLLHELNQGEREIDLLVNNAGIGTSGLYVEQDWSREQELIELNVLALARLCHEIGGAMASRGTGQILNVASVAGFQPGAWMSNYYASKAYVLHFSEGLREELKVHGVGVSVLCPGPTRTAFFRGARMAGEKLEGSKLMMSAEEVALITVKALEKNRAIIIPGWRNRLLAVSPRLSPRWLVRRLAGRINKAYLPK
ncbi:MULTISPECIES: SDR family NAD(P)-dependent oxidoreductase [unclassified Pseudomonas]|uniref:SDR family NAD(P)-dependent oxidoreductase n=1 Tax=unclassified Pseudomonas TaxID=196821 RepID=UPI000DA85576|nr:MULTISPECIES: SDR family oxidoreductase [unclassified Pseudomonas]MDW3715533.1 SDR family oxidoreductase [Pseudomonas sp. 2023EL-01195]PZE12106.1 SDR family NAD(P)-dependent oxidoreductase [Pseudomonas sp. 57B-090624]